MIKYLHLRAIDPLADGFELLPKGGVTVAYLIMDLHNKAGICLNVAKCHPDDRFCYETGRSLASNKLHSEGPLDVLPLQHPISETIINWLCNEWWPSRRKYGGHAIEIGKDERGRWISDFYPC